MTTAEKFKVWLETIYISEKTKKPLTTGIQYVTGLNALNKKFNLQGDGIYNANINLDHIRNLIDKPENFQKDYSSHFNAYLKFRSYYLERTNKGQRPLQRQIDVFKKQQIEISAIETTIKYFEEMDYIIISKEKDNVGWDLEATNMHETLLLEVKGLSGKISSVELNPNEYKNLKEKVINYKLCIVMNALIDPKLDVYSFSFDLNAWTNKNHEKLLIEERIAARMWKE